MGVQQEKAFRLRNGILYLHWFLFVLMFPTMGFILFMIATAGQAYPDLSIAPIFFCVMGIIWIPLSAQYWRQTTSVRIEADQFIVKKLYQYPKQVACASILYHNERLDSGKGQPFKVLTVYLPDDFFIVKSNEFTHYEQLKDQITQYGKSVTYQKVMTLAERNRLRWMIGGLVLLIIANIVFGYVAHNPITTKPARLITVTDAVHSVAIDQGKGGFKGFRLRLKTWPDFTFYISRRNYDTNIRSLQQAIAVNQPITLLLRQSDYRKKLAKTEPLTFGDKYDNYQRIVVFGVEQTKNVHLMTYKPIYESVHTNPAQRTFLLGFLLLLCWVGWVYIDQYKVLLAD